MADGWERKHGCTFRGLAVLPGYSRTFDKASIKSRGSRQHPAPTLRIIESNSECPGVAFEFTEESREKILAELLQREGKSFPPRPKRVHLSDGRGVEALVPIYEGKQILAGRSLRDLARMAINARGERGDGIAYVRDIARHLESAGIHDPCVVELLAEIDRLMSAGGVRGPPP